MVDISTKEITKRVAVAQGYVKMSSETLKILLKKGSPKGNVFETAKVAGIMAAKLTPKIIPMCHPLELKKVSVNCNVDKKRNCVVIVSEVVCLGQTGVEMEALTAVSVAALTIYDMMKWAQKSMVISEIKLLHKSGGKCGDFNRR